MTLAFPFYLGRHAPKILGKNKTSSPQEIKGIHSEGRKKGKGEGIVEPLLTKSI